MLGGNQIEGEIPLFITNASKLEILELSDNFFTGTIPNNLGNLHFYISDAHINGLIRPVIGNMNGLTELSLGGNNLVGSIPSEIGKLKQLQGLSLPYNKFQGHITETVCDLSNLVKLFLQVNELSGEIPECIRNLSMLQDPWLEVPQDIGGLKAIVELYLSGNHFSGMMTSRLGQLQNLQYLDLSNISFFGQIPLSFANLISLEFLDLALNALSGTIPKSMERLSYLKSINVSFNDLEGEISSGGVFVNSTLQSFLGNKGLCGVHILEVPACTNPGQQSKSKELVLKVVIPVVISSFLIFLLISIWITKRQKKGNSGSVYKGTLSGGSVVAIKVLDLQSEEICKRFDTECEVMRNVRHKNLVPVITTCSSDCIRAFVLQYMSNGSLENWLYREDCQLNLLQRITIMLDVAMATEYLHHGNDTPIVHCDLKPTNVLLDEIWWLMLMEVLTKRRPTDEEICNENLDLRKWIAQSFSGTMLEVVDAYLFPEEEQITSKSEICISSMVELALDCTLEIPESRITIKDVVKRLNKIKNSFLES
ncbi:hypothetical protein P3S67_027963 [Capsicum chacoense]